MLLHLSALWLLPKCEKLQQQGLLRDGYLLQGWYMRGGGGDRVQVLRRRLLQGWPILLPTQEVRRNLHLLQGQQV
jgi:hypothetical protein